MISDHYNEQVSVERLTAVIEDDEPTNKKEFATHIANLSCVIQCYDEDITKDISNGFGKDLQMFCSVQDIIEGDRIIRGSTEYRVVAIKSFPDYCDNSHMEVKIRAFKS